MNLSILLGSLLVLLLTISTKAASTQKTKKVNVASCSPPFVNVICSSNPSNPPKQGVYFDVTKAVAAIEVDKNPQKGTCDGRQRSGVYCCTYWFPNTSTGYGCKMTTTTVEHH